MGKPKSHVKVYHCIQCGAEVKDAVTQYYRREYAGEWDRVAEIIGNMSKSDFDARFLDLVEEGEVEI